MNDKDKIIQLLQEQKARHLEEIAFLKQTQGRKATKKKRLKPKERRKVRHLKLIAINGVPVFNKN